MLHKKVKTVVTFTENKKGFCVCFDGIEYTGQTYVSKTAAANSVRKTFSNPEFELKRIKKGFEINNVAAQLLKDKGMTA